MKRTTAQHERTGEIRNVVIVNGKPRLDMGMASIPCGEDWIVQSNHKIWELVAAIAALLIVTTWLSILEASF